MNAHGRNNTKPGHSCSGPACCLLGRSSCIDDIARACTELFDCQVTLANEARWTAVTPTCAVFAALMYPNDLFITAFAFEFPEAFKAFIRMDAALRAACVESFGDDNEPDPKEEDVSARTMKAPNRFL